jgi:hypothetical protein
VKAIGQLALGVRARGFGFRFDSGFGHGALP